ncbi:MAG: hypothetical protein WC455_21570 [Dehalococcoidia bacterium]|jgi:hypothetical protein
MSLSDRVPSTISTNLFVPSIYSNKVIEAAKTTLVNADAVNTEWLSDAAKGQIFYLPKTNTVTATEVVVGTKGSALNPLNTTGVTVTMNQWYEAPVDIDYMSKFQSQTEAEDFCKAESAYAIDVAIDTYISSLYSSLGGYSTSAYGSDGQDLDDNLLIYLMETLDENNAPRDGGRSLILDPSAMADMIKIDKFVASMYVQIGAVQNGLIGSNHPIYGCNVRVTNNLTAASIGNYCVMLHKNAIAAKVQIHNAWILEYKDLHETRVQVEALWGASEAQDAFGVPFFSRKA